MSYPYRTAAPKPDDWDEYTPDPDYCGELREILRRRNASNEAIELAVSLVVRECVPSGIGVRSNYSEQRAETRVTLKNTRGEFVGATIDQTMLLETGRPFEAFGRAIEPALRLLGVRTVTP